MLLSDRFPQILFSPDDAGGGDEDDDDSENEEEEEEEESEDQDDTEDDLEDEDDEEEWDKERGMDLIRKLRGEVKDGAKLSKSQAKRLAAFEKAEQKKEDDEKSELQKVTDARDSAVSENESLISSLKDERIGRAIELEAHMMGFADPQDAYHLITANSPKQLKYDAKEGTVSGHVELLKKLAEDKPYLVSEDPKTKRTPRRDSSTRHKITPENIEDKEIEEVLDIPRTF